jgi:hypothetical protein
METRSPFYPLHRSTIAVEIKNGGMKFFCEWLFAWRMRHETPAEMRRVKNKVRFDYRFTVFIKRCGEVVYRFDDSILQ